MTDAEQAEILTLINCVAASAPAALVGDAWDEVFAGNVTFEVGGWRIVVFNDCGDWDFIDEVIAPDGRRWEYEAMTDEVKFWTPRDVAGWPSVPWRRSC